MWLIMTPVTCVMIQLETATSPLLVPTTTLNLKVPSATLLCPWQIPTSGQARQVDTTIATSLCPSPQWGMWAFVASATSSPLMVGYRQQAYRQQVYQRRVYQWWAYQQRAYQQQAYQRRVYQQQVYRWWAINGRCINGRLLTAGVSMAGYWQQVYQWWAYKWWAINSGLSMVDVSRIDGGRIDGGCIQWAYLTHEAVFHPTCCLLYQEGPEPQWGNLFCIVIRLFS